MSSTTFRRSFLKKIAFTFFNFFFTNTLFSKSNNKKIVIIYMTRTNNTKVLAQMISSIVKADLIELKTKIPYPKNYQRIVKQVREENERSFLPEIEDIEDINQYEIIFLGFPTWGMQLPPPMKAFLSNYNFEGKIIIPFNTNGGYGIGNSFKTINKLATNSKIIEGFSIKGGSERDNIYFVMNDGYKNKVKHKLQKWLSHIFV